MYIMRNIVYLSLKFCNMDLEFNKNEDKMRMLISQMEQRLGKIYLGGGKARIE